MVLFWILGLAMALESTDWVILNDTVMGGRSTATIEELDSNIIFNGTVSLKNNGGFASMRTIDSVDLSAQTTVEIQLSGSNVPVQFIVWMGQGANLYYAKEVVVQSEIQSLNFVDFIPKSYGRVVAAPSLMRQDRSQVSVGLLVGDGYEGDFSLRLEQLNFVDDETARLPTMNVQTSARITQVLQRAIQRGVPAYNSGDPRQCAAIYQTALEDLLLLASDDLPADVQENIQSVLRTTSSMSPNDQAWAYRRVMDELLQMM